MVPELTGRCDQPTAVRSRCRCAVAPSPSPFPETVTPPFRQRLSAINIYERHQRHCTAGAAMAISTRRNRTSRSLLQQNSLEEYFHNSITIPVFTADFRRLSLLVCYPLWSDDDDAAGASYANLSGRPVQALRASCCCHGCNIL